MKFPLLLCQKPSPKSCHMAVCFCAFLVDCLYWNVVAFVDMLDANKSPEICGSTLNSYFDCLRLHGRVQGDCMVECSTITIVRDNHHHWDPSEFWPNFFGFRASIAQFVSLLFPFIPYQCPDFIRGYIVAQKCVKYHCGAIKG